ncbi:MAG: hypothetical protein LUF02_03795 [Erysipelotrichaceae bacterium]|nr:hypothetical protein [Erysipelotrichaceae bacterium]
MKSKLLLRSNVAILVERYYDSVKIYFGDGHCEVLDEKIEDYIGKEKSRARYKAPIEVYGQFLYPTKDKKEKDCVWVNLDYLDNIDKNYIAMLKSKNVFDKTIKMFLKQKEIQFKNA